MDGIHACDVLCTKKQHTKKQPGPGTRTPQKPVLFRSSASCGKVVPGRRMHGGPNDTPGTVNPLSCGTPTLDFLSVLEPTFAWPYY